MLTSHVVRRGATYGGFGAAPLAWHLEKARPAADWTESGGANIRPGPTNEQAIEGILGQRMWQSIAFHPVAGGGEPANVEAVTIVTADGAEFTAETRHLFTAGGDTLVVELPAPASIRRVVFRIGAARGPLKLLLYALQYVKPRAPDPVVEPMTATLPAMTTTGEPSWLQTNWKWLAAGVALVGGGAFAYYRTR